MLRLRLSYRPQTTLEMLQFQSWVSLIICFLGVFFFQRQKKILRSRMFSYSIICMGWEENKLVLFIHSYPEPLHRAMNPTFFILRMDLAKLVNYTGQASICNPPAWISKEYRNYRPVLSLLADKPFLQYFIQNLCICHSKSLKK